MPANKAREKRLVPPYIESLNKIQNTALTGAIAFFRPDRSPSINHFIKELEGIELIPKPKYVSKAKPKTGLYIAITIALVLSIGLAIFFSTKTSNKNEAKSIAEEKIIVITDDATTVKNEPIKTLQDNLKIGGKGPIMVSIKSGTFAMGITSSVRKDEGPRHTVKIKKFAVSQNEITLAEYDAFAKATQKNIPNAKEKDRKKYPVNFVSWKDANDYALVLRSNTGSANSFRINVTEGSNTGLKSIAHTSYTGNTSSISSASGATITLSASHGLKVGDTIKYLAAGTALNGLTSLSSYKVASLPSSSSHN